MTLLKFAHASMQFGDPTPQQKHDVEIIFSRGYHIITGTEAGPGSDDLPKLLEAEAKERGYRFFIPNRPTDSWIAVSKSLILGEWETGYVPVIPGSNKLPKSVTEGRRWGPKGLVHVGFDTEELGRINVGAAHYLTGARSPKSPRWEWNEKLGLAVGEWAERVGKGSALAFYGGDQNMADNKNREPQGDTFFGAPLTSAWDELEFWQNTGYGNIDVIASYDRDGRVRAKRIRAFNDKQLFLHTDHFLVEAVYEVAPLKVAPPAPVPVKHFCPLCNFEHEGVVK